MVSVPLRYHWKAMECPKRVNMHWGKGTEVYLFSTGKERDQELGKRVTTWCGRREVRLNIIYKVLWSPLMQLKLHGAGAWRSMILLRIGKRSFFRMAKFLYTKSLIWSFFYCLRQGKIPVKGVLLTCFETQRDQLWLR